MIQLVITGDPCAKQRPRVCKWGTYTPEKTVNYETLVKELFIVSGQKKLEGPIYMRVIAEFGIPKSDSKKTRELKLAGTLKHTKKPDYDNVAKIISDALNGLAYDDDSQIYDAHVTKIYSESPKVTVLLFDESEDK